MDNLGRLNLLDYASTQLALRAVAKLFFAFVFFAGINEATGASARNLTQLYPVYSNRPHSYLD